MTNRRNIDDLRRDLKMTIKDFGSMAIFVGL